MPEPVRLDPETEEIARQYVESLVAILSGKSTTCLRCGANVERFEQVGRCVYARPCGCRQYQGKAPKQVNTGR